MSFHIWPTRPWAFECHDSLFDGDAAEAWVPSQFQTMDQMAIAQVLDLKPELKSTFHATEFAGGGFGRRAVIDSHVPREAL